MKKIFPLLVLAVLAGCQKTDQLTWSEKRLVGSWFYTDVDFMERWSLKKDDITSDYFSDVITFNKDFTSTYEDADLNIVMNGVWQVNQVSTYNASNNSSGMSEQVIASYENPLTGDVIQMVWDDFWVNKTRIRANNLAKEGHYYFELKKF